MSELRLSRPSWRAVGDAATDAAMAAEGEEPTAGASVFRQRVDYLYQHAATVLWGHVLNSTIVAVVFWFKIMTPVLVGWWATSVGTAVLRYVLGRAYANRHRSRINIRTWYRLYHVAAMVSAIVWSTATFLFFLEDSPEHQLIIAFLAAGLAAAAVSMLPVFLGLYYQYLGVIVLPVTALLLWHRESMVTGAMGVAVLLFAIVLTRTAKRMHSFIEESIELRVELERLASTDELTSLPNRRVFFEALDREWARAERAHEPLSVVMCDIDFFKACNDRYGHGYGDRILLEVASTLSLVLARRTDMIARYGGEEFVALLPDTPSEGALQVAQRMREAVAQRELEHEASEVAPHVTLSVGVATTVPGSGRSRDELLTAADEALYKAKRAGRNRVVAEEEAD